MAIQNFTASSGTHPLFLRSFRILWCCSEVEIDSLTRGPVTQYSRLTCTLCVVNGVEYPPHEVGSLALTAEARISASAELATNTVSAWQKNIRHDYD